VPENGEPYPVAAALSRPRRAAMPFPGRWPEAMSCNT